MSYWKVALPLLGAWTCTSVSAEESTPLSPPVDETLAPYASTADSIMLPDGRKIHFVCMGQGTPTVILTAGLGDWGASWSKVQPEIAKTTRACAWDRPGFGLSDASPQAQSSATTTADLEAALAKQTIAGPFVMVGHSLGSYESLLYADRHGDAVVGMVLIDPSVPDQASVMRRVAPAIAETNTAYVQLVVGLVRGCAAQMRAEAPPAGGSVSFACEVAFPPTNPPAVLQALKAEAIKPGQAEAVISFYENVGLSGEQVVNPSRNYANMPLIVLTAVEPQDPPPGASAEAIAQGPMFMEAFDSKHDELAALSTRGINARVPGTSHYIQQTKPQVVIDAVEAVVADARAAAR